MTDKNPNAIVLPASSSSVAEAQGFPGMPGRYLPGEPVLLRSLDLTAEEARSLIDDLGVPLELVDHGKAKVQHPVPDENPPRAEAGDPTGVDEVPLAPLHVDAPAKGEPDPGRSVAAAVAAGAADDDGGSK